MVRLATINDANQLESLNNEFNGKEETSLKNIQTSLSSNKQEIVIVDEEIGVLTGFICLQIKKSFCYDEYMPEITEVYVKPKYRQRGIAASMISFAEEYCKKHYSFHKFELLTGEENTIAQAVYHKIGYEVDGEVHLVKRIRDNY